MTDLAIVTGGAGFIGGHLTERLVTEGFRVRVIERPGVSTDHLPTGVEVVFADIRDRSAVAEALRGGVWVYHLAANPNLWVRDRREFDAVNHRGAVNVIESALAAGARRVLHTSTESILTRAPRPGQPPIDEDVEIRESDAVGPYCRSKLRAEVAALALGRAGAPVVVANPTMPVGPGDRGLSPPTRLIRDFCRADIPARMDCTLNVVDVRDVADGLVKVMARGLPGRRHLLSGHNVSLLDLMRRLSARTGVPVPRWRVPYPLALAAAAVSEVRADWITGRTPQATLTGVRLARRLFHFDPARTRTMLGWSVRDLDQSLDDALDWLRQMDQVPNGPRVEIRG